jgi:competence protein ComEC
MPAVRLLIPFIAGITLCIEVPVGIYLLWVACAFLAAAVSTIIYVNVIDSAAGVYKWRYASGIAVSVAMLSLGYTMTFFSTDTNDPHHVAHIDTAFIQKKATYIGVISDPVVIREKTVSALIQLQKVIRNDTSISAEGKVLASIVKDSSSEALQYGDKVVFSGVVMLYEEPKNPDQFNYKSYQALHHIYHRVYLRGGDWQVTATDQGNALLARIYTVRTYFLSLIKQTVSGTNELAVATAIMLGYRDYVTDEVMQAYAGSGVLHVLSVSGLHVAVLYYVLSILLGWMDRRRRLEILKGIIVIIIMLFYAGLTGLSPPVLRSVWMFTLITIARLLDRDVSMYNVLGVSCLALLIWDPYYIADVGFQLSYIAVVGIVYLYPMFHGLLSLPSFSFRRPFGFISRVLNYSFDFVWGLIFVSIAAQLATFPVSLYYFHTFPNFFLLSNLLVIPLSNFVLISGMALFAVGWCHWLLSYAGWVFDHLLIVLNRVVFWVDGLPFALSRGTVVSVFEMIFLYAVIMMACWFIADRRAKVLLTTLICALILCMAFSVGSIQRDQTKKLVVYHVSGKKAIAFIIQRKAYYDFDSALINNEMLMRYNVRDHWWQCGVAAEEPIDSARFGYSVSYGRVYAVDSKRILIIDKELAYSAASKLKVDVVILSGNTKNSLDDIMRRIDFKELIFDTSNKPAHIKHWIEDSEKMKIKYHDCREHAFEMDL